MRTGFRYLATALFCAPLLVTAAPGLAAVPALPDAVRAALPDCACEADREALLTAQQEIASAATVAEARDRALEKSSLAKRAVGMARWIVPSSSSLDRAHARLASYEDRVKTSETPQQVAWEFGEFTQLASLGGAVMADLDIDVNDGGGCDFSGGEIIAIVLGFIFGIIPGIILLILLC